MNYEKSPSKFKKKVKPRGLIRTKIEVAEYTIHLQPKKKKRKLKGKLEN